ncbi:MAG: PepSY domain-containing protein [Thermoplasmataceae archaeon]
MKKKMLSSIIGAKAILAVVALLSVASVAGVTAAPSVIHDLSATNSNVTLAEQAAINYVNAHYQGNGTSKILKVENDTEKGVAVYDIKVLAPNGTAYVVQVSQSTDQVISAHVAENQDTQKSGDNNSSDSGSSSSDDNQTQGSQTDN